MILLAFLPAAIWTGQFLADKIHVPAHIAPVHGWRFVPVRDRNITLLEPRIGGGGPQSLRVQIDWTHPDTGERRRSARVFPFSGQLESRLRRELGGYTGPTVRLAEPQASSRSLRNRLRQARRYDVAPGVRFVLGVERRLSLLSDRYHDRTGGRLYVTSGTRDAGEQARAMFTKLELGDDIVALYGRRSLVHEIKAAYDSGRSHRRSNGAIRAEMTSVIRQQVERGEYISRHLRAGAVDLRSRDFSDARRKALYEAVQEDPGIRILEEKIPPHFHLDIRWE